MPLQETSGAASYDAFGGGAPVAAKYIEDFFQTWLRTGTGSSTTVTTGLNGAINETMVWTKSRSAATNHKLTDNVRGATKALSSNTTGAEVTDSQGLTAFSSTGYTIGTNTDYNNSGATYVDWQWVATPKFFDVVTYTGNGAASQTINHNLGAEPGFIITKCTSTTGNWINYHRSLGAGKALIFTTAAQFTTSDFPSTPTATTFTVGDGGTSGYSNQNGATYVAYLFAHNAGGFGLTGTDNVISCGSFTTDGNGDATVNLGYEPQWLLYKPSAVTGLWYVQDNMRGLPVGAYGPVLYPNNSYAEEGSGSKISPQATGFSINSNANRTFIYIAIRRGPMKTPTTGTSVFSPTAVTVATNASVTTNFPVDMVYGLVRPGGDHNLMDRLRGISNTSAVSPYLKTESASAELTANNIYNADNQTGYKFGSYFNGASSIFYSFRRAPGFFDEVCYTGTGSGQTINHNLGALAEMAIVKRRNTTGNWVVGVLGFGASMLLLNSTAAAAQLATGSVTPNWDINQFYVDQGTSNSNDVNASGSTYVAYLFASCPGVSKVFSYTGNGSSQTINCGFTGGARFVMIKRTDSTGDWYVWDTARGIVSGNDPRLSLNTTAAEVTTDDSVDTDSTGFVVNQLSATNINVSSATYIGLAIA